MPVERKRFAQSEIIRQVVESQKFTRKTLGQTLLPPDFDSDEGIEMLANEEYSVLRSTFGARMRFYGDILRSLHSNRALSPDKQRSGVATLQTLNNINTYINQHENDEQSRTLYDPQLRVLKAFQNFLESGGKEGYFKLPTSFGKTVLFTEFIEATGLRTLIVVPTFEIMDQTNETFDVFAPDVEKGRYFSYEKDANRQVVITTYHSLVKQMKGQVPDNKKINPLDYDLLILDEVHQSLSPDRVKAVRQFENAMKFGFSATPYRSEDRDTKALLNSEIYAMSIKRAVEQGLLSDFRVWLAYTDVDLSNVSASYSTQDYNIDELEKAIDIASRNIAAVDLYQNNFVDSSALVYCASVKHAQSVAREFRQRGISAEAVWGDMPYKKRRAIIKAYLKREIKVLCNMRMITEGFNAPNAEVCFNLCPTLSPVVEEQRGGRVLRIDPNNPNKVATVVDFVDFDKRAQNRMYTFAEVAGSAQVTRENLTRHYIKIADKQAPLEHSEFTIGGIRVVTDLDEIMNVVARSKEMREAGRLYVPEGYARVPVDELAEKWRVNSGTVRTRLRLLKEAYPDQVGGGGVTVFFATEEGIALLEKELEAIGTPQGFIFAEPLALAEEFGISETPIIQRLRNFEKTMPDHFRQGEKGWKLHFITPEGLTILRQSLEDMKPPEGFYQIPYKELQARGVKFSQIYSRLKVLRREQPDEFVGGGGHGEQQYASQSGLDLLYQYFDTIEGRIPLIPTELVKKFPGLSVNIIRVRIRQATKENPEWFEKAGLGGQTFYATPEGEQAVLQQISDEIKPEGFTRIDTLELAREFGLSQDDIRSQVDLLQGLFPNNYIGGGGKGRHFYATTIGHEALREQVSAQAIPEGFIRINTHQLTNKRGISHKVLKSTFRALSIAHSDMFGKVGRKVKYITTPEGLDLLEHHLKNEALRKQLSQQAGDKERQKQSIAQPDTQTKGVIAILEDRSGLSRPTISSAFIELSSQYPKDIIVTQNARGQNRFAATARGLEIVEEHLKQRSIPEGYVRVNIDQLAGEFPSSDQTIRRLVMAYSRRSPAEVRKFNAVTFISTPEMLHAIRQELTARIIPEGFSKIPYNKLSAEFGLSSSQIYSFVRELAEDNPLLFKGGRETKGIYANESGLATLRNRIK